MTTFDFKQVRLFADDVNAKLDRCENGEGTLCDSIDSTLGFCADRCCEFAARLRDWGRGVFSGEVAFDADAEQLWRAELGQLFSRGMKLLEKGRQAESFCYALDGRKKLEAALFNLHQLISGWVTPRLSVGPSARLGLSSMDEAAADELRRRIASLPPLPDDCKPDDHWLEMVLQRART